MSSVHDVLNDALALRAAGDLRKATWRCLEVLDAHPDFATGLYVLGLIEMSRGRSLRALSLLKRARQGDDGNAARIAASYDSMIVDIYNQSIRSFKAGDHRGALAGLLAIRDTEPTHAPTQGALPVVAAAAAAAAFEWQLAERPVEARAVYALAVQALAPDHPARTLLPIAVWQTGHPDALRPSPPPPGAVEERMRAYAAGAMAILADERQPWLDPDRHHPVFRNYRLTTSHNGHTHECNFMGALTDLRYDEAYGGEDPGQCASGKQPNLPGDLYPSPLSEDYLEWVDLLEAIDSARERFVMVELGAGYGRWLANAVAAIRRHRRNALLVPRLVGVEAHPVRFAWMRRNLIDNGVDPDAQRLLECGVSASRGRLYFPLLREHYAGSEDMDYGARFFTAEELGQQPGAENGGDLLYFTNGAIRSKFRAIPTLPLEEILEGLGTVDLIDMDIQGLEAEVVLSALVVLTRSVKKLHIGTHGESVEATIRTALTAAGWHCVQDYPGNRVNQTPFGAFKFGDGMQTWINPRLREPPAS